MGFVSADSPSCVKTVTITFRHTSIKLKQNRQITINGDEIMKFPMLFNGARIRIASSIFMVIHLPNGLEVWWDGVSRVYINAPAEFHGKLFYLVFHHYNANYLCYCIFKELIEPRLLRSNKRTLRNLYRESKG